MSFSAGFAAGLAVGRKKWGSGGGDETGTRYYYKDDPDWDWFDKAPEPAANQQIYGVRVFDATAENYIMSRFNEYTMFYMNIVPVPLYPFEGVQNNRESYDGYTIDWGDGTITSHKSWEYYSYHTSQEDIDRLDEYLHGLMHTYEKAGDYVITVTINFISEYTNAHYLMSKNSATIIAYQNNESVVVFAKIGDRFNKRSYCGSEVYSYIEYTAPYTFNYTYRPSIKFLKIPSLRRFSNLNTPMLNYLFALKYLELRLDKSLYPWQGDTQFNYALSNQLTNLQALEYINVDLSTYTDEIPQNTFANCHSFLISENIACGELGIYAFSYCFRLRHVNLSNCHSMESNAFSYCYNLETFEAPNCTEITHTGDTSIFANNYALKRISFPKLTTWDSDIGSLYNLVEIDLPSCTKFKGTIQNCYSLAKITVAEGCDFSEATIANCCSLGQRSEGLKYP